MRANWFSASLLALSVFFCSSLALGCDWDPSVDPNQDLDPVAMLALGIRTGRTVSVNETEKCKKLCCDDPNCDLALLTFPMDTSIQCLLVNCWLQGQDQCAFRKSSQAQVWRKQVDPKTRAAQDNQPQILPLLMDTEQKTTGTKETNDIICRQPVKVGSCRAAFPKFFYNVTEQTCSGFIYGGCEGNGNNFDSQDACEKTCSGVTGSVLDSTGSDPSAKSPRMAPVFYPEPSEEAESPADSEPAATESVQIQETEMTDDQYAAHCEVEPEAGPCRAAFPRWFYNQKTGDCEKFTYGGCRGNKNNHESKESCTATCAGRTGHSKKPSPETISAEYKAHCEAEPDAGPCRAAFPRWFFNHKTGNCETFIYGGCSGNENNHESKESCAATCTAFDSHHGDHHDRPAALFLFVTLAAISALLVVAVVVVSLRRRRRSRRSSWSDKQELLPDGDTHSSRESLSVPDSPKPDKA